ncbi:MAG: hypothetical protein HWE13_08975 [Gammaproteobacteria bacterium]|nr:hypothetical protein [Gammaproteobacteria bacterium]NVK88247.1 hypothetical protein [Gammaproteobacteria bacterium]
MAENTQQFIAVAQIASELHHAKSIAIDLSITSKNARALAARAGTTAAGFNEITGFIENLANLTITTANLVNQQAVKLVHDAARQFRDNGLLRQLQSAYQHSASIGQQRLIKLLRQTESAIADAQINIDKDMNQLTQRIEQTQNDLRSAKVVTVVARIESTRASADLQSSLESVADNVERSSLKIAHHLRQAQSFLIQQGDVE